ncbi:MAG: hypothetical protein BGO98_37810 [Myxococcales bacterium 68-20]|nr:MAG: hypothetical protein BGO98_37810 [Myxococcales bacterium 68-20]
MNGEAVPTSITSASLDQSAMSICPESASASATERASFLRALSIATPSPRSEPISKPAHGRTTAPLAIESATGQNLVSIACHRSARAPSGDVLVSVEVPATATAEAFELGHSSRPLASRALGASLRSHSAR